MTELEDTFTVFIDEEAAFSFAAVGDVVDPSGTGWRRKPSA